MALMIETLGALDDVPHTYTVQPGDKLYNIVKRQGLCPNQKHSCLMAAVKRVAQASGVADPNRIVPGQVLIFPTDLLAQRAGGSSVPSTPQLDVETTFYEGVRPPVTPELPGTVPAGGSAPWSEKPRVVVANGEKLRAREFRVSMGDGFGDHRGLVLEVERSRRRR